MSFDPVPILNAIESHAGSLGQFERVNGHEPVGAPGSGLTAAVWADSINPVAAASGLAATSVRVAFMVRIYSSAIQQPLDAIDPGILTAAGALMDAYSSDFDLGATVRNVDLRGAHGMALAAQAGYVTMDGKLMRVMTITLPVIINDVFTEAA